jgi:hypothetical protein
MASQFLALVGVSLFDPKNASRSGRREARRRHIEDMQSPMPVNREMGLYLLTPDLTKGGCKITAVK